MRPLHKKLTPGFVNKIARARPNHFVSIPIRTPELEDHFTRVRSRLEPAGLGHFAIEPAAAHLTLAVLWLENEEMWRRAAFALQTLRLPPLPALSLGAPSPLLGSSGHFQHKVIYLRATGASRVGDDTSPLASSPSSKIMETGTHFEPDDSLSKFAAAVQSHFQVEVPEAYFPEAFEPHITLAKINPSRKVNITNIKEFPASIVSDLMKEHFSGTFFPTSIELCRMQGRLPGQPYPIVNQRKLNDKKEKVQVIDHQKQKQK